MKMILPLRFVLLTIALAITTPLVAAQKGFIGLALDGKAFQDSLSSLFNPTLASAWVKYVFPNSPADGHHITAGDIVLEIDGMTVPGSKLSAFKAKCAAEPGKIVHLKFRRANGEIYTADLTAVPKP